LSTPDTLEARLVRRIAALGDGEQLAPERELAQELQVGRAVLRAVLDRLAERGVITRQRRTGTRVNPAALRQLLPPVYLARKDHRTMDPGSQRRLRHELLEAWQDSDGAAPADFRLVPVPYVSEHLTMRLTGRPTIGGTGGIYLPDALAFGSCADLTERVRQWPGAPAFWPNLWEAVTCRGRIYGIPTSAHIFVLIANRAALQRAGCSPDQLPACWDELRATARRVQASGAAPHGFGLAADYHLSWLFEDFCNQAGGTTIATGPAADEWLPQLDSPAATAALRFLGDLRWRDRTLYPAPDTATLLAAVVRGDCPLAIVESGALLNETLWHGYPP